MKNQKLVVIDGHSCMHRAYHALPHLTDSGGRVVNAVYGFLKMLKKIIDDQKPTHILVAFDHEKPTFRHKDYSQYKSKRAKTDPELVKQFPIIFELLDLLNIRHIRFEGFEADDIIATLSKEALEKNLPVAVITGDKDIMQIVENGITVIDGMKDKVYDHKGVVDKLGVEPRYVADYLALVGDSSDNLPGVRGIGPVGAKKLINSYGGIEEIYSSLNEIEPGTRKKLLKNREAAYKTKRLALLVKDLDLSLSVEESLWEGPETAKLREKLNKLNFTSLVRDWVEEDELRGKLKVKVIRDANEFKSLLKKNKNNMPVYMELFAGRGLLAGLSISFDGVETYYIPSGHKYLGAGKQVSEEEIKKIIKNGFPGNEFKVSAYDFKSIYKYLRSSGLHNIYADFDAVTAEYIISGQSGSRSLKEIASRYLEWVPAEISLDVGEEDIEKTAGAAAARINAVLKLKDKMGKKIKEYGLKELYREVELPVLKVLGEMEMTGIYADVRRLKNIEDELREELKGIEKEIYSMAGEKFNINSPRQLSRILFHKLSLPPVRKTKTSYSTADDVLDELKEKHPLPGLIQKHRQIQKLLSTYIQPLPRTINSSTGRIHTTFNITGTSTGRLSSNDPNLQNIPVKTERGTRVRKSFRAEDKNIFLSADYSQIDLRVLAHICGDENLIDSFKRGDDIHTRTAASIFEVKEKEVTREMRNKAKAVNFGIVYGMSAWGLEKRADLNKKESEEFIEKYFSTYPGVKNYMEKIVEEAKKKSYVKTILKRRRYLPEINSSNYMRRQSSERMAINTPIQGSSADIIKKAMAALYSEMKLNRGPLKLLLQIHDELLFELPQQRESEYRERIKKIMEEASLLKVPLRVDFKKGPDWGSLGKC